MNTKKKIRNIAVCNDALRPDLTGFSVFQPALHDTGWRRLIGSPKLQIIFHKRATQYRSLLPKMTYKDKGSYESSQPCRNLFWKKTYLVGLVCTGDTTI